jgi:hypothetical protein
VRRKFPQGPFLASTGGVINVPSIDDRFPFTRNTFKSIITEFNLPNAFLNLASYPSGAYAKSETRAKDGRLCGMGKSGGHNYSYES